MAIFKNPSAHSYSAATIDGLGNVGEHCTWSWGYDDTSPTCSGAVPSTYGWANYDITVTNTACSDSSDSCSSASGCTRCSYGGTANYMEVY